ncbi:variant erythrocyte surface antigen beta subunit, putative [Babesia ovis]|uniref:Variant erythrocyte surface antigen beta subunit, putative n=1 Tax=Babesia ovis TaxID=5869 RepID=A0A9W5TDK3_BABOV|nr:variant erythrocyte surface antigen beta subunit, putative [Babesia ovis]
MTLQYFETYPATDCLCPLSQAVVTVLRDVQVKEYLDHQEEKDLVKDILSQIDTIGGVRTTRELIEEVAEGLRKFVGYQSPSGGTNGIPELTGSGIGCPGNGSGQCKHNTGSSGTCPGYQSSYGGMANLSMLLGGDDTGTTDSRKDSWTILAKIFLGAIPFVFSGLSYMYWACSADGSAGREGFKNGDTVNNESQVICHFMKRCGFETSQLRTGSTNGSGITVSELKEAIKASGILTEGAESSLEQSFAMYLEAVRSKVKENNGASAPKDYPLLTLNTLCTGYFRALNQPYRVHRRNHRLPRTIREILYWLSCVQYCPVFRVLVQKMRDLCERNGGPSQKITFYSDKKHSDGKFKTCLITPSNCVSYFLSAALVAPMVLLSIQDTIECLQGRVTRSTSKEIAEKPSHLMTYQEKIDRLADNSKPVPIHDLYANTLFEFRFPMSETESYYLLQDCLVALYYQMYFLKQQCNFHRLPHGQGNGGGSPMDGFDWTLCRYGEGVNSDNISGWKCTENTGQNKVQTQCGQQSNPSPLQAFLCDCLKGFTCPEVMEGESGKKVKYQENLDKLRDKKDNNHSIYSECYPEFLEHRNHVKIPGTECPVPMGFSGSFRSGGAPALGAGGSGSAGSAVGMSGLGINGIVMYYVNDDLTDSCLYQVTRCISSLTRRVPRSTGTLYGFFQGIISVYQSGSSTTGGTATEFKEALDVELLQETFGLQGSVTLMDVVTKWKSSDHKKDGKTCECLDSLSGCEGADQKADGGNTCGKYLHPLTGSLYNSVATQYCDTYLSWILYLSGRLQSGLKALLDAFRDIDCSQSGCVKTTEGVITTGAGNCECRSKGCIKGNHGTTGTTTGCCCWSVVHCAGVLSTFYRFGFSYVSPFGLSGRQEKQSTYNSDSKRTCQNFYKQLQTVITGDLFSKVLDDIRGFLYTTRLPFTLVIFGFWSIVLVYLLWSITGPLDLMHIQSHWRSPGSYLVPLQRIIADGSRNMKRVCTIGYFQDSGDRLLSEGVSDVYL